MNSAEHPRRAAARLGRVSFTPGCAILDAWLPFLVGRSKGTARTRLRAGPRDAPPSGVRTKLRAEP